MNFFINIFPITKRDTTVTILMFLSNVVYIGMLFSIITLFSVLLAGNQNLIAVAKYSMIGCVLTGITVMFFSIRYEEHSFSNERWTNFGEWRLSVKVGMFIIVNWLCTIISATII